MIPQDTDGGTAAKDSPKQMVNSLQILLKSLNIPAQSNSWSRLSFYFLISNTIIMQIAHVTYMLMHITEVEEMANTCSTVSTTFQGIFKLTSLYFNSSNIKKMFAIIDHDFWSTYIACKMSRESLNKMPQMLELLMFSFFLFIVFICILFLIPPLLLGIRELPLVSWYPFAWQNSPLYEILYVWQWFINMYNVCYVLAIHDFLFLAMMVYLIVQYRILQDVLRQIGTDSENKINNMLRHCSGVKKHSTYLMEAKDHQLLVKCVQHHLKLLDFSDLIENTFSPLIFLQFFESVTGLCMGVFLLKLVNGINFLKLLFFIIGHLTQLLLYCFIGNEVMYQSVKVADAAFDCDWHKTHCPSLRKSLTLIIQRAQRSKKFTALGMADLNMNSFIVVIRSSISISTLLKTIIDKQNKKQ